MAENNESFLQILNNYFSNLSEHQVLAGTTERIKIPIEWLSTDKIDRAVVEQAFINLFCKANKQYRENLKKDKQFYRKIDCLEIERTESGVNLMIRARDGGTQTKVVVTSDRNLKGPFYAITEEDLYEEVLYSYNYKSAIDISKKFKFNYEERNRILKEDLRKPEIEERRKAHIQTGMIEVAKNLTRYYEYMIKQKAKHEALRGTIQQRKDERTRKPDGKIPRYSTRKSAIYDLQDREEVLLEMAPIHIVNIDNIEENNTINKFAYVTYIFENPRGKEGYLFVAEPFEGNHHTRVRFVPREEFDELSEDERDKFVQLAEELTEMSVSECSNSKRTKIFKHTTIDKYREKFRRIILGEPVENSTEKARYAETDKILFEGQKRISLYGIETKIEGISISDSNGTNNARTALYGNRKKEEKESEIPSVD